MSGKRSGARKISEGRFSSLTHPEIYLSELKIPAAPANTVEMLPRMQVSGRSDLRARSQASLLTAVMGGGSVVSAFPFKESIFWLILVVGHIFNFNYYNLILTLGFITFRVIC